MVSSVSARASEKCSIFPPAHSSLKERYKGEDVCFFGFQAALLHIISHMLSIYCVIYAVWGIVDGAAPVRKAKPIFHLAKREESPRSEPGRLSVTYGLLGNPPGVSGHDLIHSGCTRAFKHEPFVSPTWFNVLV